jgi:hypothetical protein
MRCIRSLHLTRPRSSSPTARHLVVVVIGVAAGQVSFMFGGRRALAMVGDWMGSLYTVGGRRWDLFLFLDSDGRYERTIRLEPDYERHDTGRWECAEPDRVLRLMSDAPDDSDRMSGGWQVLSVATCAESNVLLVLREIVLASRNLPVVLSRVHCNGRAYGTNWQQRQAEPV